MATSFLQKLKRIDAFPKLEEEAKQRTTAGAGISVAAILLMLMLFWSELSFFMSTQIVERIDLDDRRHGRLRITFNVTFPSLPCAAVSVDVMDLTGEHHSEANDRIFKRRLDQFGEPIGSSMKNMARGTVKTAETLAAKGEDAKELEQGCGSCYGAGEEGECCNTCESVKAAYRKKAWTFNPATVPQCAKEGFIDQLAIQSQQGEGCMLWGKIDVTKVQGHVHFAPGAGFSHAHDHVENPVQLAFDTMNTSHTINELAFGASYPGAESALKGYTKILSTKGIMQYYLKVVPTDYEYLNGNVLESNQYSVTTHFRRAEEDSKHGELPGVYFYYDFSELRVHISEQRHSFGHFITGILSILGGVFTVMGVVDKFWYRFHRKLKTGSSKLLG